MDLGTKEHTSLSVCHCLGRRLGEGAVQQAAAVPLRRQGEGGAAGGQGPTACRLPPGACQGERGRAGAYGLRPAAGWRLPLPAWPPAPCALSLAPAPCACRVPRAAFAVGRRPSRWRVAAGGWGGSADARGAVVAYWRAGEAVSGLGRTGERQGRTVSRNLLLDVGLGQFKQVEKKNFGPNPGPWPGWPGV